MAKQKIEFDLPMLDDIFTTQEERDNAKLKKIYELPLDEVDPFPEHPFKVKDDEDMMNLVDSILENGILTPTTVRKKEDGRYEMVSGHRRLRACQLAGLDTIRAEVVELDRDEATIYMVDSNMQRSVILPSEKAFSYKMRLDAMKRMPGRPSKNSVPVAQNKTSRAILGEQVGESQDNVRRYIRLTDLVPELLDIVDDGKIGLRPAVELSYLPDEFQYNVLEEIEMGQCTPSHAQAIKMKKMHGEGKLSKDVISSIMEEEKPNQREKYTLRADRVNKYLPKGLESTKREEYILQALEYYGRYRQRQKEQER
jgi:ParB family chromosome partitioning protein